MLEGNVARIYRFDVVQANFLPILKRFEVGECFFVGAEVFTNSFRFTVITVSFEVSNCVHHVKEKNIMK